MELPVRDDCAQGRACFGGGLRDDSQARVAHALSAYALALLVYEAGVPQDLLPVVSGRASEISHEFATNPTVRKISFTGSTEVGAKIFADSAADIKNSVWNWAATRRLSCLTMLIWTKPSKARWPASSATAGQTCVSAPTACTLNPVFTTNFAAN